MKEADDILSRVTLSVNGLITRLMSLCLYNGQAVDESVNNKLHKIHPQLGLKVLELLGMRRVF